MAAFDNKTGHVSLSGVQETGRRELRHGTAISYQNQRQTVQFRVKYFGVGTIEEFTMAAWPGHSETE